MIHKDDVICFTITSGAILTVDIIAYVIAFFILF